MTHRPPHPHALLPSAIRVASLAVLVGLVGCARPERVACNADADCASDEVCASGACRFAWEGPGQDESISTSCAAPMATPASDTTGVDVLTDIRVELSPEEAATADIRLTFQDKAVEGRLFHSASRVVLVPYVALQPRATYTVELIRACGTQRWTFTTAALDGDPSATPRRYTFDPRDIVTEPAAAQNLFQLLGLAVIVSVDGLTGRLAFLNDLGEQDVCEPTVSLTGSLEGATFAYHAELTSASTPVSSVIARAVMHGEETAELAFVLEVDVRKAERFFPLADGWTAACTMFAQFGLPCGPCSDEDAEACIVTSIHTTMVATPLEVQSVTAEGACANPYCSAEPLCN